MRNNEELVDYLVKNGYLKTRAVINAFKKTPRELFVRDDVRKHAYADEPLTIGLGQTISAPSIVAMMTELLEPKLNDKVLEVGSGSGYQAALLSRIVKRVFSVELDPQLSGFAKENAKRAGCENIEFIVGDGSKGYPKAAPFDKIIITCAAPKIPSTLVEQLREGGRIVAPVGGSWLQQLILGVKKKGQLKKESHGGCVFVPLRKKDER